MSALGFIPDVAILSVTFILIILFRKNIARLFMRIPLPNFLVYLISSIPFIIFEENINCLPTGCLILPPTIPLLLIFVLVLGLIVRFAKIKNILAATIGFSIFGIIFEYVIGVSSAQLQALGGLFAIFMIIWVGISYAYLVVVPLIILLESKKSKN